MVTATRPRCRNCGGNLFYEDEDGQKHCLLCDRPYHSWAEYGRKGGLRTLELYGRERMKELGQRGGLARRLPTLSELRQQTAPKNNSELKGGMAASCFLASRNNLKVLKELWKEKWGEFGCNNSPQGGFNA